jgi:predicted dehydrogenase
MAIVGLGAIARTHVRALEAMTGVALVAGVDVRSGAALTFRDRVLPVHRTVSELCRHHRLDAAVVATPTGAHAEVCRELLAAGTVRRLLVEKPLAPGADDVREVLAAARDSGVTLEVMYHFRHASEVRWAASRHDEWGRRHGPVTGVRCLFSDAFALEPDRRRSLVSSWVDSGINALSVLDRFVPLTAVSAPRALPDLVSTFEARVEFGARGDRCAGTVFTTWNVGRGSKLTRLSFADGAELLLDHSATFGRLERDGVTVEVHAADGAVERGLARYQALFRDMLAADHVAAPERDRLLHELLLGAPVTPPPVPP